MEKNFPLITKMLSTIKYNFEKANSDFQFWLENFNLSKQREIAKQWQLTINEFYLMGIIAMFISIAIMTVWILYRTKSNPQSALWNKWQKFWINFEKKFPEVAARAQWGKLELLESELQQLDSKQSKKWLKKIAKLKRSIYSS